MNGIEIIHRIVDYINVYIWQGIPVVLKGVIITMVFVILFRKKLKEHPAVFYIYPALYLLWGIFCSVGYLLPDSGLGESFVVNIGWALEELGLGTALGIGLIIIVMFIGVLPKTTFVTNLFAIRTEMSIIGATLLLGHGFSRLGLTIYYLKLEEYNHAHTFFISFVLIYGILGPILVALLVLPWITSFRTVRKKMSARTWKKLQTYLGVPLFIGMLVFGLALNLSWSVGWYPDFVNMEEITVLHWAGDEPISLGNGVEFAQWLLSAKIYAALLVSYSILRIKKVRKGNRSGANLPVETPEATA